MSALLQDFADCFKTKSANSTDLARRYVGGLLSQTQRKNMERMDERLGQDASLCEDNYQATQQFISTSAWDEAALYRQVAARANERLGGTRNSVLVIDESAFAKKGAASVGVSRQWNGRLGKQDNSQTGVFSVLNCGTRTCLTGTRLFLAQEWSDDPERCTKVGVPKERVEQGHLTKIDLARELITEAITNGLEFGCIAMDAFYGRDSALRRYIDAQGLTYCTDVPANIRLFTSKPTLEKRPPQLKEHTQSAEEIATRAMQNRRAPAEHITLRQGDDGDVQGEVKAVRVWEWSAEQAQSQELWLIIRRMADGSMKHSLCNAAPTTQLKQLARWQAARFWVERCFQDAKSHCGMAQYQARGWRAWHHHMALVALAVLFQMQERMNDESCVPNLTSADIVELMEWALIKRPSEVELIARIEKRHAKREKSAKSKRRLQKRSQKSSIRPSKK